MSGSRTKRARAVSRSLAAPPPPSARGKRFLVMCEGGNVRSVAMAYLLKDRHGQNAVACSWRSNPLDSRIVFYEWADYIVIMQAVFIQHVPAEYHAKTRCVEAGPDVWGSPMHTQLLDRLGKIAADWAARNWEI